MADKKGLTVDLRTKHLVLLGEAEGWLVFGNSRNALIKIIDLLRVTK